MNARLSVSPAPFRSFLVGTTEVRVYTSKSWMGVAVANHVAAALRQAVSLKGSARMIIGGGNSQLDFVASLARVPDVDWRAVEMFHMDEYVGMPTSHPASLRRWIKLRVEDVLQPGRMHYVDGEAADVDAECRRYGNLLQQAPIDVCVIGFGENGHIAFNDPHVARFDDPVAVKRVDLDQRCRMQQVGEGHFGRLEDVPKDAITITCPMLVSAAHVLCCVPELRKAEAVKNALQGPIAESCPASLVRRHASAVVYLDTESASLLNC